jgi:hypothetical protein
MGGWLHMQCVAPNIGLLALVALPIGWVLFQCLWGKAPATNRDGSELEIASDSLKELLFCLAVGLFIIWFFHSPC